MDNQQEQVLDSSREQKHYIIRSLYLSVDYIIDCIVICDRPGVREVYKPVFDIPITKVVRSNAGDGYTGAVKPPVRRTGNRKSGPEETGIYAAEPPSRRNSFPGWGRQLIGYIIRSVPDPVRIPLSWSGSWQDRSERC